MIMPFNEQPSSYFNELYEGPQEKANYGNFKFLTPIITAIKG